MTITHLLDEQDDTHEFSFHDGRYRTWTARWFPFEAQVQLNDGPWRWVLKLVGADSPFAHGDASSWSEAFQAVADAQRAALATLKAQL